MISSLSHKTAISACHVASRSVLNVGFNERFANVFSYCTSARNGCGTTNTDNLKLPAEPQNCCMSGCPNCVWVAYAEEVAKILNDGGEVAKKKIMENVKDPNLRAFLMLELQGLFKKGK